MLMLYKLMFTNMIMFTAFLYFFFFQAEDGIRDTSVTGVQTCALPICFGARAREPIRGEDPSLRAGRAGRPGAGDRHRQVRQARSEERRVGKECRCRWSPGY